MLSVMIRSTSPPEAEVWGTFGGFRKYRTAHALSGTFFE
jgi:hypothetical protein